ncbi:zf-TFIIB domain-containing protein [Bythopirellula polymerisocia]
MDRCDQCLGCWVDHGELDVIVQEKQTLDEELSIAHLRML